MFTEHEVYFISIHVYKVMTKHSFYLNAAYNPINIPMIVGYTVHSVEIV